MGCRLPRCLPKALGSPFPLWRGLSIPWLPGKGSLPLSRARHSHHINPAGWLLLTFLGALFPPRCCQWIVRSAPRAAAPSGVLFPPHCGQGISPLSRLRYSHHISLARLRHGEEGGTESREMENARKAPLPGGGGAIKRGGATG
ncbi:hypothetical protein GCM10008997_26300 [Halomonas salifodinae]